MPRGWFAYDGSGDITSPTNYFYIDHLWECDGHGVVCTVYAYYTTTPPVIGVTNPATPFTPGLRSYINVSAAAAFPIPNVGKRYLYVKNN